MFIPGFSIFLTSVLYYMFFFKIVDYFKDLNLSILGTEPYLIAMAICGTPVYLWTVFLYSRPRDDIK